jgi:uncharacterized protein (TIGR02246 family)
MRNRVSILIAISLVLAHSIFAAPPSGDVKLDTAILKANSEFLVAVKTGDAATIAAPYADNGVFVLADGTCIQGRTEIEKMYRTGFEKSGPPSSSTLDSKNVILDGDVAYEAGNAQVTVIKEGKPVTRTSRYLTVWQRAADGEWKIIRNIVLS